MHTQVLLLLVALFGLVCSQSHSHNYVEDYEDGDASYNYNYAVQDEEHGDFKSHQESRNGKETQGVYTVKEADGRTRIVRYTVGPHTGFNAVVEYIGEANTGNEQFQYAHANQRFQDNVHDVSRKQVTIEKAPESFSYQALSDTAKFSQPQAKPANQKVNGKYQSTPSVQATYEKPQKVVEKKPVVVKVQQHQTVAPQTQYGKKQHQAVPQQISTVSSEYNQASKTSNPSSSQSWSYNSAENPAPKQESTQVQKSHSWSTSLGSNEQTQTIAPQAFKQTQTPQFTILTSPARAKKTQDWSAVPQAYQRPKTLTVPSHANEQELISLITNHAKAQGAKSWTIQPPAQQQHQQEPKFSLVTSSSVPQDQKSWIPVREEKVAAASQQERPTVMYPPTQYQMIDPNQLAQLTQLLMTNPANYQQFAQEIRGQQGGAPQYVYTH